tara:strand:- start:124 stop:558 length:435 start_codon:yes stop_codon:yes gene_type:complete
MSHWNYNGKMFDKIPEDAYGFVYRITNSMNGKFYIGRKQFISIRRTKVLGRKNRKVTRTEMKWREYTGSNKNLNADIKEHGKANFKFEVLTIAYTKGQCNFLEIAAQFKLDVLTNTNAYNDAIGSGQFKNLTMDDRLINELKKL